MARPKKGEEIGATVTVCVRLTPERRSQLDDLARKHKRSLTDEVRAALEQYVAGQSPARRRRPRH